MASRKSHPNAPGSRCEGRKRQGSTGKVLLFTLNITSEDLYIEGVSMFLFSQTEWPQRSPDF